MASVFSHVYSLIGFRTYAYMVLGGALQAALLVLLLDPRRSPAVPASTTRATGIEDVSLG